MWGSYRHVVTERDCERGAESFSNGAVKGGRLWTVTSAVLSMGAGGMLNGVSLAVVAGWLMVAVAWLAVMVWGT